MGGKSRVPMQVAPEFEAKIKSLQKKIMKAQGESISLRDLTGKLAISQDFDRIEKALLGINNTNIKNDIKVKIDRRGK